MKKLEDLKVAHDRYAAEYAAKLNAHRLATTKRILEEFDIHFMGKGLTLKTLQNPQRTPDFTPELTHNASYLTMTYEIKHVDHTKVEISFPAETKKQPIVVVYVEEKSDDIFSSPPTRIQDPAEVMRMRIGNYTDKMNKPLPKISFTIKTNAPLRMPPGLQGKAGRGKPALATRPPQYVSFATFKDFLTQYCP